MREFVPRRPLNQQARDEADTQLFRSKSINILRAINSAIPDTRLTYEDAMKVPYGEALGPGYVLTGTPVSSDLRINMHLRHGYTRRKVREIDRKVLTQSALSVTTAENALILSGTKTNILTDSLTTRTVGGGIAYLEPVLLSLETRPRIIFSAITDYLHRLDMIDSNQRDVAHKILAK